MFKVITTSQIVYPDRSFLQKVEGNLLKICFLILGVQRRTRSLKSLRNKVARIVKLLRTQMRANDTGNRIWILSIDSLSSRIGHIYAWCMLYIAAQEFRLGQI